jgi:hypothetical protein
MICFLNTFIDPQLSIAAPISQGYRSVYPTLWPDPHPTKPHLYHIPGWSRGYAVLAANGGVLSIVLWNPAIHPGGLVPKGLYKMVDASGGIGGGET